MDLLPIYLAHDSTLLAHSDLLPQLQQFAHAPNGNTLCIYGNPAYPVRIELQGPFKGARINQLQKDFNKAMSQVRVSVEWLFADVINFFKFLDFKKDLKIRLSAVGKMYII